MFSIVVQIRLKIKTNGSKEDFSPYIDRVAETWSPFVIEGATSSLSAYGIVSGMSQNTFPKDTLFVHWKRLYSKRLFVHRAQSESTIAF